MVYKKKLIEVALPLDAINKASAREKSIRHGHPSTLHLWWARRPLAAARAVIFSQMVDDPSEYTDVLLSDPNKKRAATRELAKRKSAWEARKTRYQEAQDQGDHSFPDPGIEPTLQDCIADIERERLFRIIEDLVQWENTTNEAVLQQARDEIWQSWRRACAWNADHPRAKELFDRHKLPAFHDPFAGGGSLPLEAQRLGLEAYASDLNPVAVLINKSMIEIPPKFASRPPVNPDARKQASMDYQAWPGARGLAEDVRHYGKWMRDEAEKRIGHLYPKIEITEAMVKERPDMKPFMGQKLTVIAWLWARTVKSPNPAFANVDVPLASTFMLCTKAGKEAYVEPIIENGGYRFTVKVGKYKEAGVEKNGTSAGKRKAFTCLISGVPIGYDYIRSEAKAGRMGARMMAIVAEGERGRVYLPPIESMEAIARQARPEWKPDCEMPQKHRNFQPPVYGMNNLGDIFTRRQLVALTTFSDLVHEASERVRRDALAADRTNPSTESGQAGASLAAGSTDTTAYADAVAVYLSFAVDKGSNYWSSLCAWHTGAEKMISTFGRQALPMVWDYTEANPFSDSSGNILLGIEQAAKMIIALGIGMAGLAVQADASVQSISANKVVSTDPPYYDNIAYADLSDFFYVWLRRSLAPVFPDLFTTLAVPKTEELIAAPNRHGSKEKAELFFLNGMTQAMHRLAAQAHLAFPVTIYYAFKQSENDNDINSAASTGWETFLDAVIRAGFAITGTWPIRTEYTGNLKKSMSALASSIIIVCRTRAEETITATRREFVAALKAGLPPALVHLQHGNIAPVDLAQAAIGPGMAIYTRYAKVLDAEGKPLTVREALMLINQTLDEVLAEQEGDFDADSRWALAWFEQSGFAEGEYGVAEVLSKAKATSIESMKRDGILASGGGKVRLRRPEELPIDWNPETDHRITAWEMVHQLIKALESGGEGAAANLVARLGTKAETARELAYRLYTLCDRKKRAAEALSYNGLVQSWPEIMRLAREEGKPRQAAPGLFDEEERV
jgi:putative DNA methylase